MSTKLDDEIAAFQKRGWTVQDRTATSAVVYPPKPPPFRLGLNFLLCILTLGFWLIPTYIMYFQSRSRIKRMPRPQRLVLDSNGDVRSTTL